MATQLPQRLAAILAADIAGYTRLMEADEAGVVAAWRRARGEVIDPTVAKYQGRIVKLTGDGFLAEFSTIESAVNAAIAMQDAFAALFASEPADRAIAFRMGVNIGDIWVDAEDIYGAGVNVAARLEGLADPGGICISGSAYDAVKHKIPARYESMGRQALKNVAEPIEVWRVYGAQSAGRSTMRAPAVGIPRRTSTPRLLATAVAIVVALSVGAMWLLHEPNAPRDLVSAAEAPEKSVAVLPFADLSPDGDQGWLADGLTEETLNSLAQLRELRVPARTSSFQFKGVDRNIVEIAQTLRVANVVEGSVRRSGDSLRVTAQLIRAADGYHLWSNTYDNKTTDDLFAVQRDVAEQIAAALDILLDERRRAVMFRSGTSNVEAFEAYLRGRELYDAAHRLESDQTLWAANAYFQRALELDPNYAVAAMGLLDAFMHQLTGGPQGLTAASPYTQEQALTELQSNLKRVVDNGPNAAMQLAADLTREFYGPTWYRMPALIERLRAERLSNPNNMSGEVITYLAPILLFTKNHDLLREIAQRQLEIDPLSPASWGALANVELFVGNFERTKEVVGDARRVIGDNAGLRSIERLTLSRDEQMERMRAAPNSDGNPVLAAMTGDFAKAIEILEAYESRSPSPAVDLVPAYYLAGATDRVRSLVERADQLPGGSATLVGVMGLTRNELTFDLGDTPNFLAKMRQAGLDPASYPMALRGPCGESRTIGC